MTLDLTTAKDAMAELVSFFPRERRSSLLMWLDERFQLFRDCEFIPAMAGDLEFSIIVPGDKIRKIVLALRTGELSASALHAEFCHEQTPGASENNTVKDNQNE